MKIIRTILNLPATKDEITDGNPWENHKKLLNSMYEDNKKEYIDKINNIFEFAKNNNADLVLLPACTLVYKSEKLFQKYIDMLPENISLLAGTLNVSKIVNGEYEEKAIFVDKIKNISTFDGKSVNTFKLNGRYFYAAISSTIKNLKKNKSVSAKEFKNLVKEPKHLRRLSKNIFALDLGHHQYNGRYMITLNAVNRYLTKRFINENNAKHSVILSFWRYDGWNIKSKWLSSNTEINPERTVIDDNLIDIINF